MVVVPCELPVSTPVPATIVATAVLLLLQVPPGVALVRVTVLPTHTLAGPLIAPGNGLTVSMVLRLQPLGETM
jgi:hypothetical protein